MHQYQERDGEEDRTPGGKTRLIDGTCGVDEIIVRAMLSKMSLYVASSNVD